MAYARKDYSGAPASTTLAAGITSGSTSITITASTGWPSGTNGSFYAVIDPGQATEEKILVTSRTGTTLNTVSRGVDGSTAASHDSGATIYPCFTATDADEANYAVAQTVGKVTAASDLLVASSANTFSRLAKGSNSTVLGVDSGGTLGYATLATGQIAANAVTNAKLAGMTRGTVKVGNASGAASDLAIGTSGYYLKSDGTDVAWAAGAAESWTTLRKASDESVSSSTTLQDDNDMTFTAANGTYYYFEYVIIYASPVGGGTPDLKIAMGESGTTAGVWEAVYPGTNDVGAIAGTLTDQTTTIAVGTGTSKRTFFGSGTHVGAGGSFKVRWAQNTSNANNTTLYTGSYFRYRTVS